MNEHATSVLVAPPPALDAVLFERAKSLLDREPSAVDGRRLTWLEASLMLAIGLIIAWIFATQLVPDVQVVLLYTTLAVYLIVAVLLGMNVPLLLKLRQAAQLERKLGLTRNIDGLLVRSREPRKRRFTQWVALHIVGYPLTLAGLVAVSTWPEADWITRAESFNILCFGLSCLFTYPMRRAANRLQSVAAMRRGFDESHQRGEWSTQVYDALSATERRHIEEDRRTSIRSSRTRRTGAIVVLADEFRRALTQLAPEEAAAAQQQVVVLMSTPYESLPEGSAFLHQVPGTDLQLTVARQFNRLEVVDLRRRTADVETGGAAHA